MSYNCDKDLFCGINRVKSLNPEDMSDLEKKHIPVIELFGEPKKGELFDVVVEVGYYLKHPNEHGHFIQWIELYSGDVFLGRIDLASGHTDPHALFFVKLQHLLPFRAFAHCNMHGTWEGIMDLPWSFNPKRFKDL